MNHWNKQNEYINFRLVKRLPLEEELMINPDWEVDVYSLLLLIPQLADPKLYGIISFFLNKHLYMEF